MLVKKNFLWLVAMGATCLMGLSCMAAEPNVVFEPSPISEFSEGARTNYTTVDKKETDPLESPAKRNPFSTVEVKKKVEQVIAGPVFTQQRAPEVMPKMKLRGHLQGANQEVLALLEINGDSVHIVREGDTVGLHEFGYDSVVRVKKIDRLHLVVESGTLGQLIIVR